MLVHNICAIYIVVVVGSIDKKNMIEQLGTAVQRDIIAGSIDTLINRCA